MSNNDKTVIEGLLKSIDGSIDQLSELEQSYKQQKEQVTTDLASYVRQLAVLSDSQAIRAQIVRELYWNKKVSATLISEAFGLKVGSMKRIAGALIVNVPCNRGCGNSVKKTYTSRSNVEDDVRSARRTKGSPYSFYNVCEECKKREKIESEADTAQRKAAILKRNEQLRNMAWEDFIETKEWIETRNDVLHGADYQCEICHTSNVSLNVYPHADTPQDFPSYYIRSRGYNYFVLCNKCVSRCSDLINEEKGEYIKREFMSEIIERNQQH